MKVFIVIFIVFNLITFGIFGIDKLLARMGRQRIREKTLLTLVLLGGSVGGVFAQKLFRHKTQKLRSILWIILMIQFVIFEVVWNYFPKMIY